MLVLAAAAMASGPPPGDLYQGSGQFQVDVDYGRFYGDSSRVFVEFYYGIHRNMLTFRRDSVGFHAGANITWLVKKDTAVVSRRAWTVPCALEDSTSLAVPQTLVGLESAGVPPGEYLMVVIATDAFDPGRRDSIATPFLVTPYPADHEALSDVELCSSIRTSASKGTLFYKNTLEVIPNPTRLFGVGLPIMYYYVEAYNLDSPTGGSDITVHTAVLDALGREVITHDKVKPRLHESSVEIGTVNLTTLKGGTYVFSVSLLDTAKKTLATSVKKFFVYRPGAAPDSLGLTPASGTVVGEYAGMSVAELDQEFDYARYTSTDAEKEQYKHLTDQKAKQKFLAEFWQRRASQPTTSGLSFKEEYFKRLNYTKDQMSLGFRPGWKTDRGRVYIVYGPPDEIERNPSSSESNPYETWHYNNIQGGVIFVFVDRMGMGDYTLVHSDHRDELHDENWYQHYAQKMR